MKTRSKLGLSLLIGMLSTGVLAAEKTKPSVTEPTPVVQNAQATSTEHSHAEMTNNANLVNINTATAAEIQDKLVGIGAKKAQAIVEYRTKNGAFSSLEQLTDVSGIGKATLDKNRDRILLQ
ncbi:ComEA family DNA-binding protein [Actinobacillus equuli]|uniref:ComEA family DNA-binding protein n=1 Tax=Actinobacillus equuli TaxID=718 RepID=UPI00244237AA|nr:ComEA family DNA-binding protein [Actinobacillus equuli]WGE42097.1 helix-hairpin-helix domain-containing protein [Actinobacillus equuli subsp. haemolyticus]WGE52811.1 helix-hairpin-helix domain-containing protein [Actinobacillus equuli subsp. haemolyticus]WGE73254.1 helix-hairpin-helix domain-containing protein [Actinobacillus equuli subsp. haemolyticus]